MVNKKESFNECEVNKLDFFLRGIDWISVINDGVSYDEMLLLLESQGISFEERYFMNKKYVFISKSFDNYRKLIFLLSFCKDLRITRIDFKMDFKNDFDEVVGIFNLDSHSEVSKQGKVQTIYFNSRQSDLFCRLYNKQVESDLPFPLTRLEYEIKGNLAYIFSKRISYLGFDDSLSFLFDKINEFNSRKGLNNIFYITTGEYLPVDVVEDYSIKNKFRRFVKHNRNSYSNYMEYFNITPDDLDKLMNGIIDLETFLEEHWYEKFI